MLYAAGRYQTDSDAPLTRSIYLWFSSGAGMVVASRAPARFWTPIVTLLGNGAISPVVLHLDMDGDDDPDLLAVQQSEDSVGSRRFGVLANKSASFGSRRCRVSRAFPRFHRC